MIDDITAIVIDLNLPETDSIPDQRAESVFSESVPEYDEFAIRAVDIPDADKRKDVARSSVVRDNELN